MNRTEKKYQEQAIPPEMWSKIENDSVDNELIAGESLTYWQDVWRRFKRNKSAMLGLSVIVVLTLTAIFFPFISRYTYFEQDLSLANIPPILDIYQLTSKKHVYLSNRFKLYEVSEDGELIEMIRSKKRDMFKKQFIYEIEGEKYILDYNQLPVKLKDGSGQELQIHKTVWNKTYYLGTDSLGRDLLIRQVYGARISLAVALVATIVNFVIGVLYGGISGYFGGRVDNIMMRIVEIINTMPLTLYVILIMVILQSGLLSIIVAIGTVFWVDMARIVRGQVLALKEQEFVYAARTMGGGTGRILFKHLLPNTMGPIIVTLAMLIPGAIFIEAFMSFIGLGVAAPMSSWGTLCSEALGSIRSYPYQLIIPAFAISITMFAFNFLVDGLRDTLDPRLRK